MNQKSSHEIVKMAVAMARRIRDQRAKLRPGALFPVGVQKADTAALARASGHDPAALHRALKALHSQEGSEAEEAASYLEDAIKIALQHRSQL